MQHKDLVMKIKYYHSMAADEAFCKQAEWNKEVAIETLFNVK